LRRILDGAEDEPTTDDRFAYGVAVWAGSAIAALLIAKVLWADLGSNAKESMPFFLLTALSVLWAFPVGAYLLSTRGRSSRVPIPVEASERRRNVGFIIAAVNFVSSILGIVAFILDRMTRS
jgi:hypothetical protein